MSKLTLSPETLAKLEKLNSINQSLKIVQGGKTIRSVSESKTTAVETTIAEEFPRMFCIYDLREFLAVYNIIEKPVIDFADPRFIVIHSEDGSQRMRYIDAGEDIVKSSYVPSLPDLPSLDLEVTLSKDQIDRVMKAARMLGSEFVGFTCDGTDIYVKAFDKSNGDGNESNAFSIKLGQSTQVFKLFYKSQAWQVLDNDCVFTISKKRISKIVSGDLTYLMTLDANSSFEG